LKKNGAIVVIDFPEREVHGGTGKRQREKTGKSILDFSASINPFPPTFPWDIDLSVLTQYPDDRYCELKEQIGRIFCRAPAEICV
jgi:threonine-phosphate decarboxylase